MIRTFGQDIIRRFAENSRVPVINGLTNAYHPCQVLADIFTFGEHRGPIRGKTVTWVGDANNMAYTWIEAAHILGFKLRVSTPCIDRPGAPRIGRRNRRSAMGFEEENDTRKAAFAHWCVDAELMSVAQPDALFMHCLPAHRGEEVSAEVIDGPQSVVWDEAENRLHVQKALMEFLMLGRLNH
ncbi:hypothetical protein DFQ30_010145 [Apophysomyces sp. BC1015]|nr:hypothetical protein DFQ30_010145 [Apophysomyces sp. BC1015]